MENTFETQRKNMVQNQIIPRGINNDKVIKAMIETQRDIFVPDPYKSHSYEDTPLPIGYGQTISQPFIVAYMAQLLELKGDEKILEIGSGCGYNAAILSKCAKQIYTIEIVPELAEFAKKNLQTINCKNVEVIHGDGKLGYTKEAPYDIIVATAFGRQIPTALPTQLKEGGKILIPLGDENSQTMTLFNKINGNLIETKYTGCKFVPIV